MGKERGLAFSFTCLWKHFKKSKGLFFFLSFPLKSTNCSRVQTERVWPQLTLSSSVGEEHSFRNCSVLFEGTAERQPGGLWFLSTYE